MAPQPKLLLKGNLISLLAKSLLTILFVIAFRPLSFSQACSSNLALGKVVTATSVYAGNLATRAFDGDATSRWESAYTDNQAITVDLGQSYTLCSVNLTWQVTAQNYTIDVSPDGASWTTVANVTGNSSLTTSHTFTATARYVRMQGTLRASPFGYSIYEFEVIGTPPISNCSNTNVAQLQPAVASSSIAGNLASYAFDNNATTRWESTNGVDPQSIYVDLGAMYNLCRVVLNWEAAYGEDYTIDISGDAVSWTTAATITGNYLKDNTVPITGTGRYVRMTGTKRGSAFGYSLYNFAVYALLPALSITKTTDGAEAPTAGVFRITLPTSITFAEAITVNYTLTGTATNGTDYTIPATAVVPAGQNGVNVSFTVIDDKVLENNETIIVTLTGGTSTNYGPFPVSSVNPAATATITDNDNVAANKVISLVKTTDATEPSTNGVFTVSLPAGVTVMEDVTANYTIAGTATNGTDYTTLTGSVIIPAGQNSVTLPVTVTDDNIIEGSETVIVTITGGTSATFGAFTAGTNKTATVTIADDDNIAANKIISIAKNTDAAEPSTNGSFIVSLPAGVTVKEDVTVTFNVAGSTATSGGDYIGIGTTVKILAGNNSATVNVNVINDNIIESTETVIATVTAATSATFTAYTASTTNNQATVNISDEDGATNQVISITKTTDATEPATNGVFKISLPTGVTVTEDVTVNYTIAGTATSGTDYTALTGTVKILAGQNSVNISVPVIDDKVIEVTETVIATVTGGTSSTFGTYTASTTNNAATVIITDNDNIAANKVISIVKTTDASEPATDGLYTVSLPTGVTLSEDVTANFTVTGTATAGVDYTSFGTAVVIPAGQNTVTIPLDVMDDNIIENNETAIVTITGGTSVLFGAFTAGTTKVATANIADDDNVPANKIISIVKTADAAEPSSNGSFTVSLPAGITVKEDVTVTFNVTGSTATTVTDYTAIGTSIKILAGNNSATINVNVVNDNIIENNELVVATVTAATSATMGAYTVSTTNNSATVTITDDDNTAANKVISIVKNTDAAEPSTAGVFKVSLPTGITTSEDITVTYTVAGTATGGTDYTALTGTVTILAGQNNRTFNVTVTDDKIIEGNETVIATITGGSSVSFGTYTVDPANSDATVTITDNDNIAANKIVGIVKNTDAAENTTNGLFTVSLPTGVTVTEDVTVSYTVTGTATNGTDYTTIPGSVIIPAGSVNVTIPLMVTADNIIEGSETVIITLNSAVSPNFTPFTISTTTTKAATLTITDDDNIAANKIISIVKTADASEPASAGTFTVSLPAGITVKEDITVNFNLTGSTATTGIDYTSIGTNVKILAGNNSADITVNVIDDNIIEGNEVVTVNLTTVAAASTGTYTVNATSKTATITIADDENTTANKTLSIVKTLDAAEPATNGNLIISLPTGITAKEDITVTFGTAGGNAASGTDYLPLSGTIKILAGQNSVPVTFNVFDDNVVEGNETAIIPIAGATSATIGTYTISATDGQASVIITDDDVTAANKVISIIKNTDAAEPAASGQYTVSLPTGVTLTEDVTVNYTVSGTATVGADYTALSGTVTILSGQNNATITLGVTDDKILEGSETVNVAVTGGSSVTYGAFTASSTNDNATITISDDDNIAINKVTSIFKTSDAGEPATSGQFTVSLPTGITVKEDVTVNYTATGTAIAGTDYTTLSGSVIIPAGQNSATFAVNVIDDTFLEGTETVIATLNGGTSVSYGTFPFGGSNNNATVNISDDDNIPANKVISIVKSTDAFEPSSSGSFTVSLPPGVTVGEAVMVNYTITGTATSGTDFTALTGSVKISAGQNTATIAVNIIDDKVIEPTETIIATVTGATSPTVGAYTAHPTKNKATAFITDDDDIAANKVISIVKTNDASEPATNGNFTISLPAGVSVAEDVEVTYTSSGDAMPGVDYTTLSGTVIIPAGQNSVLMPVKVADDKIVENLETVGVVIDGATSSTFSGYTIDPVKNNGTVSVSDDDNIAANKIISIVKTTDAAEPATNGSYTVKLPTGITVIENVTVNYTVTGSATAGTDYTTLTGMVTIPAGQNSVVIPVNVTDDKVIENAETVIATITNGSAATYGAFTASTTAGQATINVTDNDNIAANKVISIIKNADAGEPATNGSFTVSLPAGVTVTENVTINYTMSGTATNGADYTALTGSVTILAGQNSALIPVTITDDKMIEGSETFIATITGGASTSFGALSASATNKQATVTITDDDNIAANKVVSIVKTTDASEPAVKGVFTVKLPTGVTVNEDVTVNYTIAGTATVFDDYIPLSGSVIIPAGQNSATIDVNVADDNLIEGSETVIVTVGGATSANFSYTINTVKSATVTIADNDNTTANKVLSIVKTTDASEPASGGSYTVSLPAGIIVTEDVTVNYTVTGTATAGQDYAPLAGSVTIPAGQNSATIDVYVIDDGTIEGSETVITTLNTATGTAFTFTASGQATMTIADDDNTPANKVISLSSATDAAEPATNGAFMVSLPSGVNVNEDITVSYTIGGTAGSADYTALTGTVKIPAGQNNVTIDVNVTDDNIIETDETVMATLTAATGTNFSYTFNATPATVMLADDDNNAANEVISITNTTNASEPATAGVFAVSLPTGITATENITVTYTVAGTAGSTDYTPLTGTVTIPAGQNSVAVNVNVIDDKIIEGNETVIVTLTGATSPTFTFTAGTQATVTISDNDNTNANKVISIVKTLDAAEPATNGRFTVSLPTGITVKENVTVNYSVSGIAGSADYTALTGSVVIPAGQNSAIINVNVIDDKILEGNETVTATLTGASSASFTYTANTSATVKITDDDNTSANQVISIAKTLDAAEPGTNGSFTVSLPTGLTCKDNITVSYTVSGTAANTDYAALSGSVVIPAGQNSATINVSVIDDKIIEGNETVVATLTNGISSTFIFTANTSATVTITDDDNITANKIISIVKTQDAAEPATNGSFTVSLPAGVTVTEAITVSYNTGGTANNTDYTALSGTVIIPAGQNSAAIAVNVIDDVTIEGNETVNVSLTGATSATLTYTANTSATVTISDNDNTSVISIVKTTDAAEPATNGRYTVSLPPGITIPEDITVSYTITGTAGSTDYTALSGSVVIPAGQNSVAIDVNVTNDNIVEGNETVIATITGATAATFTFTVDATNNKATVTISDDDNIPVNKAISLVKTSDASEPAANGSFTVSLPAGITITEAVTVNYTVSGTAGSTDYTALSSSVIIPAGQNSVAIPVNVTDDKLIEGSETVIATLTGATSTSFTFTANTQATVTISDNDNTAANTVISIIKTTDATEPATNGLFTASLPAGITVIEDITVNYAVTGTANGGTDYSALTGSLIIPAGQSSVTIPVAVMDDNLIEVNETVIATLTGATSANFTYTAATQATVTINDNDNTMQISIVKTTDAAEPAGNGSFTVSLPMGLTTTEDVTVNYTVAGTATAGTDYTALANAVVIPAGQNSATIDVTVTDDSAVEGNETVIVTLTGGTSASFTFTANPASSKATVTIADNDVAPVPKVISIAKTADATEPSTDGSFTVRLDMSVPEDMTVNYTVAGTAGAGTDYTALTGSVVIPAGQTSVIIPVTVIDDSAVEASETVKVTVTGGTSANFTYIVSAPGNATVTISDDDVVVVPPAPKVISIAKTTDAAEPSTNGSFTVSLDVAVTEDMTVNYTVSGTAIAGTDYAALTGSVIIPAGQTSVAIPVNVIDDQLIETIETVNVSITGGTSANFTYKVGTGNNATVIVSDDDNTTVNKEINVYKTKDAAEPFTHGEFVVNIQSIPATDLTVNYTITGTAKAGTDYQVLSGSVLIPAGSNTINIPVYVIDNLIVDNTRTVVLIITGGTEASGEVYTPGINRSATVDITDNDITASQFETWKLATIPATDVDGIVLPGELITYTIFVRNIGTAVLPQVTVTDAIPANTGYVSGGTLVGSEVNFTITNIQPGAVKEVSFVVKTNDNLEGVTDIRNTAYVTDGVSSQATNACDPEDGTCGIVTIVPVRAINIKGDLSITKSPVNPAGPYIIGQTISYDIVVTNAGQTTFTNVLITDELPAGLDLPATYTSDKGAIAISAANRRVICTVNQLQPGETVKMTITCKILSGDEIKNVAYVVAAEPEQTLDNNRAVSTVKTAGGDLYFVSAFKPGAAVNGRFTIVGLEKYPGSRLTVFDRWGSLAYKSENYQNNWTGQNVAIGVYIYVVEVRKPEGMVVYKGSVTIIK